jgi:FkbM family methyltransferase
MRDLVPAREYVRWEEQLPGLITRLGLDTRGVVQVGAHTGQEVAALTRCGFRRLVMVEPNRDHAVELSRQLRVHHQAAGLPVPEDGHSPREVVYAAAGREAGRAVLFVTEYDQQASVLPPLAMPVTREETIPVIPVRDVQHGCNVLVADVQGAELDVLAGADLDRLELVVVEASTFARYSGGSTAASIAEFLRERDWHHVTQWTHARPNVADDVWVSPAIAGTLAEAA